MAELVAFRISLLKFLSCPSRVNEVSVFVEHLGHANEITESSRNVGKRYLVTQHHVYQFMDLWADVNLFVALI
jgi:hypothetical protein